VSAPPQKGLVAHYPFDEESSIGPNISLHGDPNTVPGIEGQALGFDGSREYAIVDAHNRTLDLASPEMRTNFTISVWFKTNEDGGGILGIMGGEEPTYPDGHDRHIFVGGGDVRMRVWDQDSYELRSGLKRYNDGEWHNAVMVVKKGDGIYGYVDGKRVDSNLNHDRSGFTGVKGGWSPLHITIGYSNDSTFFEGRIDDVRIYNRALSVSQIKKIYETSK
jgi:hypothetical protein